MSSSPIDFSTLSDSGDQSEFMISCDDGGSSASDDLFDSIVGALENVLMDEVSLGVMELERLCKDGYKRSPRHCLRRV